MKNRFIRKRAAFVILTALAAGASNASAESDQHGEQVDEFEQGHYSLR